MFNVDVIEDRLMTLIVRHADDHDNPTSCQDVREDGVNPSLPRNCERTCSRRRPIHRAGIPAKLLRAREEPNTTEGAVCSPLGKVAGEVVRG